MFIIRKLFKDAGLKDLVSGASVALLFKISGTCLTFLFALLLARSYGADESGLFFLCLSIVEVLSMISKMGLAQSSIAFIGRYSDKGDWSSVKGIFEKSVLYVSSTAILLGITLFVLSPMLASGVFSDERLTRLFRIIALAIMPVSLMHLVGMSLQGLRCMRESQFIIHCCDQLCLLAGLIIVMHFFGISAVALLYVVSSWLTVGIGFLFWRRKSRPFLDIKGSFSTPALFNTALPLMWTNLLMVVGSRAGTFTLGILSEPAEVAIYNITFRISMLTNFFLLAVNAVSSPKFAALYSRGDMKGLARTAQQSTMLIIAATFPLIAIVLLYPEFILSFFGNEFTGRGDVLSVLISGQCVNIAAGPVGMILAMCGKEKSLRNVYLLSTPLIIVLQFSLIPFFNALGAALATAVYIMFLNAACVYIVHKELHINILPNPLTLIK